MAMIFNFDYVIRDVSYFPGNNFSGLLSIDFMDIDSKFGIDGSD